MDFSPFFPMWDKLTPQQQNALSESAHLRCVKKGTVIHNGSLECTGLLLIRQGQLRAFSVSPEGREITLYRLFPRDICLFSAYCIMKSIQFDVTIEAEKDTEFWLIPPNVYKQIMEQSAPLANYTNELIASRFSDVMWLMEQVLWKSFDQRLGEFLLEEARLEGKSSLNLTHETIAKHLGTAREVVTRMLRYFQSEGYVRLTRGTVELTDPKGLEQLCSK